MKRLALLAALFVASSANAATIAQWTFETSAPSTAGSFAAEIGAGSALGYHASASTYSSPAGNGSAHSFSSNGWAVGDYYQFSVSTLGFDTISLALDQTGSNTGPKNFSLFYSTNGSSFTSANYNYSLINGAWSSISAVATTTFSYNLSAITALNNQANLYFRLVDTSTTAISSTSPVASAGTDRVDNFTVTGLAIAAVPETDSYAMMLAGLGIMGFMVRRRK